MIIWNAYKSYVRGLLTTLSIREKRGKKIKRWKNCKKTARKRTLETTKLEGNSDSIENAVSTVE